ncbi:MULTISPECIES: hypothetical protein [unclassified Prochlorococcus]|uniref:hypothetical protein n=1 Tax=unclassified Prochlorococcus TaxID=2627481 RepID=UPI000559EF9C|nr:MULTISPECIES: hypothetical protein [unclassified Prochlorococcus]
MAGNSLGYEFLAPSQPLGILILVIGGLFTATTLFVFINVNQNDESNADRKRKKVAKEAQLKKIARLYPKKNRK